MIFLITPEGLIISVRQEEGEVLARHLADSHPDHNYFWAELAPVVEKDPDDHPSLLDELVYSD